MTILATTTVQTHATRGFLGGPGWGKATHPLMALAMAP